MDFLKELGLISFLFFLVKGLLWLVLFALVYFGFIDKKKVQSFKERLRLFRRNKKSG